MIQDRSEIMRIQSIKKYRAPALYILQSMKQPMSENLTVKTMIFANSDDHVLIHFSKIDSIRPVPNAS